MDQGWTAFLYETRSGNIEMPVELESSSATRLLTGQGTGNHKIRAGKLPLSLLREITDGNRYSLAIGWADDPSYCGYAGVIQGRRLDDDTMTAEIKTRELPAAIFSDRTFFGVNQYNPGTTLTVEGKSASGAVRAFLAACMAPSAEWALPIDLPADGSGTFKKIVKHEETLSLAAMIQIVRDLGYEVDFRPYFTGNQVRLQTRVATQITHDTVYDLAVRAPGARVTELAREEDWSDEFTGVGVFGNGQGSDRPYAYSPVGGSGAVYKPVRDSFITLPDMEVPVGDTAAQAQLQAAADAKYLATRGPKETTPFSLHIWGIGPRISEPGQRLDLWSYGGLALADGPTSKRVTGVRLDLSTKVTPEVATYAA
jgi:hypothetical protein